ncbi:MAG: DUF547 domain-containing protein [Phototrophicales bacterium]|nr:MAG: DUF547 domain-containing protein [Phototrophicales bacterium]
MTPRRPFFQRLYLGALRISDTEVLNEGENGLDIPQQDVAAQLRLAINQLTADGLNLDVGVVDYCRLAQSDAYQAYRYTARSLQNFDLNALDTERERRAFWINLYNALIIDAVIAYGAKRSITEIPNVFDRAAYRVGGFRFSANDIEHGILRANAGHPVIPGAQFRRDDPRLRFILDKLDPRIHFALVCAANSCPPIGFYDANKLDAQLDLAARAFINNGNLRLDRATMTVHLSAIFSWYAADFGAMWYGYRRRGRLIQFATKYVDNADDRAFLETHMEQLKVRFIEYDWDLNDGNNDRN